MVIVNANSDGPLRVGLVGYGLAGKAFHAPLITGLPGLILACVVSSQPQKVWSDSPGLPVLADPQRLFDDPSIDLVVIATPNESHHPLAKAALLAGKHVLVDKPCTVTLQETEDLLATASAQRRVLTVFQSRRFDSDFLALNEVLKSGQLGRVVHMESHFDRYRPQVLDRWRDRDQPGAGLWLDLGAHLVDQAMQLWGCPDDLLLDLSRQRDGAGSNDWFHAVLRYESLHPGLRVVLQASALVPAPGPRFAVHGTRGSFIKFGQDAQENALKSGQRPQWDHLQEWGKDPRPGHLHFPNAGPDGAPAPQQPAPNPAGNYLLYYANLRDHLCGQAALEVQPKQVRQLMALLSRGEQSQREGRFVSTADLRTAPT